MNFKKSLVKLQSNIFLIWVIP